MSHAPILQDNPDAQTKQVTEKHYNRWAILFTVAVMSFMSTLDSSIINVALPLMQQALSVDGTAIQLVSSAYLISLCMTVLVFGRLGDIFGKVRFFQFGVALFTVGSLLCGLSTTFPMLVISRVLQGVGGSSALATNMGIVTEIFPASERGRTLGIVSTFISLGLMCGPVLGGVLIAYFPWEAIFLINVPIGVIAFGAGVMTLPRDTAYVSSERPRFDVLGTLVFIPALFCLYMVISSGAAMPMPLMLSVLGAGLALFVLFIVVERRADMPLVRVSLFRNSVFTANVVTMLLVFCGVGATEYLIPFFLQNACGYPSDIAGILLTAIPIAMAVLGPISGAVAGRVGSTKPCLIGLAIYAVGIICVAFLPVNAGVVQIYLTIAFMSVGSGLFQSPNNSLVMGAVEENDLGFAGSLVSLIRNMGMSLGVSGGTALLYGHMSYLAQRPISSYVPDRPELFEAGFSFALVIIAVGVALGFILTVLGAYLRRRQRQDAMKSMSVEHV